MAVVYEGPYIPTIFEVFFLSSDGGSKLLRIGIISIDFQTSKKSSKIVGTCMYGPSYTTDGKLKL